jgi:hypothetical protein
MIFRGFEFEDQPWFPEIIRDSMTDYLRFLFHTFKLYQPVLPLLKEALVKTNTDQILDLCSGSGGAMESIYADLKRTFNADIKITLSDLFPSLIIYQHLYTKTDGGISYIIKPVDACNVPSELKGFRTLFSGFHHFDQEKAKEVLRDAVDARQGIGIFDGGNRSLWMILLIIILHPILLLLCTPFFRPFRISRILFTYLIPVIPFCTIWDGIFSILRLYKPDELLQMAHEADNVSYTWISGKVRNKFGMSIVYLIGYPTIENN